MFRVTMENLLAIYNRNRLGLAPVGTLTVVWFVAMWLLGSPVNRKWSLALLIVAIIGSLSWLAVFLRLRGRRKNTYDPTKSDDEEEIEFSWMDGAPVLIPLVVIYIAVTIAAQLSSWFWSLLPALFATGVMFWVMSRDNRTPNNYISPRQLFNKKVRYSQHTPKTFTGSDAVVAVLHASVVVPGAAQRSEAAVIEELRVHGHSEEAVASAIEAAAADGRVVKIREKGITGSVSYWLTLTEQAMEDFQREQRSNIETVA